MGVPSIMNGLHSVKCSACLQQFDVEYAGVPVNGNSFPRYCAYCGSASVTAHKDAEYWRDLAESLGFGRDASSVQLVRTLYSAWPTEEYSRFRDFVEATLAADGEQA